LEFDNWLLEFICYLVIGILSFPLRKGGNLSSIKFGTDGWRAVIDEDFTPENVEKVIQAFCDVRKKNNPGQNKVVLGYDRRLKCHESANLVAEVLAGNGFEVQLSDQYCPTPCVSWMVKNSDAVAGIMVTASHNPWQWNGIKFKEGYGGSAASEYTQEVEQQFIVNERTKRKIEKIPIKQGIKKGLIHQFSPKKAYVEQLKKLVDVERINECNFKILNDPLFGAGTHFLQYVLGETIGEIHVESDPKFGGLNPEPIDKNLTELMDQVKKGTWDIGLATDGDADRIGAIDEEGNYINSHQIFALLLKHYVEDKGLKGPIIKSVSTTQMINKLCEKYGLELIETPIGFKHICKKLVEKNALMGGEESGGISFAPHIHERDGVLNGLMILNMMASRGKGIQGLIAELYNEIGEFYFHRDDIHLEKDKIQIMNGRLKNDDVGQLAGRRVANINRMDGVKYILEDGSWLLIRASGTEPLVRVYAEAATMEKVARLIDEGKKLMGI